MPYIKMKRRATTSTLLAKTIKQITPNTIQPHNQIISIRMTPQPTKTHQKTSKKIRNQPLMLQRTVSQPTVADPKHHQTIWTLTHRIRRKTKIRKVICDGIEVELIISFT